ncbi:MAG: helix-turn-helix transcriptional regulator [Clostridia bacterium]|nr:helix-turn-helix transcriptional regulator [Clostridia bacterium]
MNICKLTHYGIFDTRRAFAGKKRTTGRVVPEYEIEFFTTATGKAVVNQQTYDIDAGALLCAKPGQVRMSVFDFRCFYLHIQFDGDSPYRTLLDSLPDFYRIIDRAVYGKLFEDLIRHLLSEGYHPESDYVNAKLLELFYYLRRDAQRNRNYLEHFQRRNQSNPAIPAAVEWIRKNYHRELTLAEMAGVTGYSPNYFHHIFTSVMGKTPQQYLLELRIRRAKYLLAQSEKSLSEIAYECGFSSQAYFTEQFKKFTYTTPGQYRKQSMEKYQP